MSALRAGTEVNRLPTRGQQTPALDKLTKWLPGDALVLYVAGITAFQTTSTSGSWALLAVMWFVCMLLVAGAAFAVTDHPYRHQHRPWHNKMIVTAVSMVVTAIAFGVWSMTVPGSAWQHWSLIHDNSPGVTWAATLVAAVFGALVDPGVEWIKERFMTPSQRKTQPATSIAWPVSPPPPAAPPA